MGKSILMSIKPQYVCEILNGKKTIEIRKRFPKDYVGWVYIYCTKEKPSANIWVSKTPEKCSKVILSLNEMQEDAELDNFMNVEFIEKYPQYAGETIYFHYTNLNGKVVAKFWCDKVDTLETEFYKEEPLYDENSSYQAVKRICLEQLELCDYDEDWCDRETLYTNDDYFNEEEETSNKFLQECCLSGKQLQKYFNNVDVGYAIHISKLEVFEKPKELKEFGVVKAPQSYMFIEGE